ncbi:DUF2690 domain-containing protein [Streptomyces sp. NPDC002851]
MVVAVVAALVGGVAPVVAERMFPEPPPPPPPGCPGAGCDGKNPQSEGCAADAVSWRPEGSNPVSLEVRYSTYCGVVWGRITRGEGGDQVTVQVEGGSSQSAVIEFGRDQFTPMATVGDTFHATACAVPTTASSRTGQWSKYCAEVTEDTPCRRVNRGRWRLGGSP